MPSARNKAHERRLKLLIAQVIRRYVAGNVIRAYKGLVCGIGKALCVAQADQQRTHEPRPVCGGYGVNIIYRHVRLLKRIVHNAGHLFHMRARSKLRHHAAVFSMYGYLGINAHGKHVAPSPYHACGRLIAGAFYGKHYGRFFFSVFAGIFYSLFIIAKPHFCLRLAPAVANIKSSRKGAMNISANLITISLKSCRGHMRIMRQVL